MKQKSNTFVTVLITCAVMLCLFAFTSTDKSEKPAEPTIEYRTPPRDYQIQISDNAKFLIIYDKDRVVGTLPLNMVNSLGRMIELDNQ